MRLHVCITTLALTPWLVVAEIEVGSTKAQVLREWGTPDGHLGGTKKELLLYKNSVIVHLDQGKVTEIENQHAAKALQQARATAPSENRPPNPTPPPSKSETLTQAPTLSKIAAPASTPVPAQPRRTPDPTKAVENRAIYGLLTILDLHMQVLATAPQNRGTLSFTRKEGSLTVSGLPPDFFKSHQTQFTAIYDAPISPVDPKSKTALVTNRRNSEMFDGKPEDAFLNQVYWGDDRNGQIRMFVSNCRSQFNWLTNAANSASSLAYTRNGDTLTVDGLPPHLLRTGMTSLTMKSEKGRKTYNGLNLEVFLNESFW